MKIAVIGSGAWGSALANVLADNNINVVLYGRDEKIVDEINKKHILSKYLGDSKLNEKLVATTNFSSALKGSDYILIAVPSKSVVEIIKKINLNLDHKVKIINATKGLEINTNRTIQNLIYDDLNSNFNDGVISILGPSFAKEVVNKNITCVCSISNNMEDASEVSKIFSNSYFRLYALDDVVGAEIFSSMKNAIAIASGICLGLGFGENTKAALITRGLKEMSDFGKVMGAKETTFMGLTGVGDLMLTCNTFESRNFSCGFEIGKVDSSKEFLKKNKTTVEGIATVEVIHNIALKKGIDLPIISALYDVLYQDTRPSITIKSLMNRPLKAENGDVIEWKHC